MIISKITTTVETMGRDMETIPGLQILRNLTSSLLGASSNSNGTIGHRKVIRLMAVYL